MFTSNRLQITEFRVVRLFGKLPISCLCNINKAEYIDKYIIWQSR